MQAHGCPVASLARLPRVFLVVNAEPTLLLARAVLRRRTSIGRATIADLRINDDAAVALRRLFMSAGALPRP
jgi:hypothetical protein